MITEYFKLNHFCKLFSEINADFQNSLGHEIFLIIAISKAMDFNEQKLYPDLFAVI